MIPILVAALSLFCSVALVRRYHRKKRRNELFMMKRHAATYVEEHKNFA